MWQRPTMLPRLTASSTTVVQSWHVAGCEPTNPVQVARAQRLASSSAAVIVTSRTSGSDASASARAAAVGRAAVCRPPAVPAGVATASLLLELPPHPAELVAPRRRVRERLFDDHEPARRELPHLLPAAQEQRDRVGLLVPDGAEVEP